MMTSRVLFMVQIERASKGLQTTMNLSIEKKISITFSTVIYCISLLEIMDVHKSYLFRCYILEGEKIRTNK